MKIYISNAADRDAVATILFRNGYTVKLGKEKQGNKSVLFVEYWKGVEHDTSRD